MNMMDKQEYLRTQKILFEMATLVADLDLNGFVEAISFSESIGPMLDPTLYMKGRANLEIIKRMAIAARAFKSKMPTDEERMQMIVAIAESGGSFC